MKAKQCINDLSKLKAKFKVVNKEKYHLKVMNVYSWFIS